jgi:hypothetical protein
MKGNWNMLTPIGLGNTRILTDYVQKSPQTLDMIDTCQEISHLGWSLDNKVLQLAWKEWGKLENKENQLIVKNGLVVFGIWSVSAKWLANPNNASSHLSHSFLELVWISLFTIIVKVFVFIKWSYSSPLFSRSCWQQNLEWLAYFEHVAQSLLKT